jgi:thiosulfate/3-mercaptopyruvate sulfurtransferase
MSWTTLVETDELAAHLRDPALVIVDCRFSLDDTDWGERAYAEAHIPKAAYAHLDRDLSGEKTGRNGRHPLPDPASAAATFGRLGIGAGVQVVACDQQNGSFASRLWWMLRWLGHDAVAVLDGGFAKWTAERRPTASGHESPSPRRFQPAVRRELLMSAGEVAERLGNPAWRLIDARAPERYRGEVEPLDRVPGHIPGAVNRPYRSNVDEQGTFRPDLAPEFQRLLAGVAPDRAVVYCGSGVTACHDLLAMEHAGLRGAKLYAGSWSEWSSDPARPVENG